ncbi:MAG: (2Fe-2S)-binding protein [Planctomycetota bacterium]
MRPDDEVCYCCHVSLRKLVKFARRERPNHPSQMVDCLGAGTGCGWCIPIITKIANDPDGFSGADLDMDRYVSDRAAYRDAEGSKNRF